MNKNQDQNNDAQAIISAVEKYANPRIETVPRPAPGAGATFAILPDGMKLESVERFLEENRDAPKRVQGTAKLETTESFSDYVKQFAGVHSKLFASEGGGTRPVLLAVIDHHGKKNDSVDPHFGAHRAQYDFPLSPQYKAWNGVHEKWLSQAELANFLEERLADVIEPGVASGDQKHLIEKLGITMAEQARLVELSKGLAVLVHKRSKGMIAVRSGEVALEYSETNLDAATGQVLKVPDGFLIGIPVFTDEALDKILVRLRYRVGEAGVVWQLTLHERDAVFRNAFHIACDGVKRATALPLLYGTPES